MTVSSPWKTIPYDADYGRPARKTWRDIDWTDHEHDVAVNGSRLHYLDYGAADRGMTFLLAHGLGGALATLAGKHSRARRARQGDCR